jgi:maleylacetate reductase
MTLGSFVHEQLPGRIVFGAGKLERLGDEVDRLGAARALLISNAAAATIAERAGEVLGERVAERISKVAQHVPQEEADRAVRIALDADAGVLIPVGGGSAVGLAKAVALTTAAPIVAVPTTYAGSEMTPIYGITSGGHKRTGRDPRVLPKTVVYDPELTTGLSSEVTATTGMNALAHAVEALYAPDASPVAGLLAVEAIRVLARGLPQAVLDGRDLKARGTALYGAYLAGTVLATAGMALHHTIAHVLGGTYGLPHGPVNAVLLSHVVAFNEVGAPHAVRQVAQALGAAHAPEALFDLASSLGAPTSLRELGLESRSLEEAAALAARSCKWNPREVTEDSVLEILSAAYEGRSPRSQEER